MKPGPSIRQVLKSDRVVPVQSSSLSCPTCELCRLRTDYCTKFRVRFSYSLLVSFWFLVLFTIF